MKSSLEKQSWIDILKGIGMLLVIWGHVILYGPAYDFIYSFHMPLFFFVSGLLFNAKKYKSFKEFFKRRLKTLIVPYLIFSLITYAYWVLIENRISGNSENVIYPFIQIFIAQGSGGYMLHNIPLWFVTCLFVLEIVYYYINKYTTGIKQVILVIVLALLGAAMTVDNSYMDFTKLFWSIEVALIALPFYMTGNKLKEAIGLSNIRELIEANKIKSAVICFVTSFILVVLCLANPDVSMGTDYIGNWFLFYINAYMGILIVTIISIFIKKNKLLELIGENSFFVMATHFPVRKPIVIIVAKLFNVDSSVIYKNIGLSLSVTVLTVLIEIILILILKYIRKAVVNKWKKRGS